MWEADEDVGDDTRNPQEEERRTDNALEAILRDLRRKAALLRRIGLDDPRPNRQAPHDDRPTSSGMTTGGWGYPPAPFWALPPHVGRYRYSPFPDWGARNRDCLLPHLLGIGPTRKHTCTVILRGFQHNGQKLRKMERCLALQTQEGT